MLVGGAASRKGGAEPIAQQPIGTILKHAINIDEQGRQRVCPLLRFIEKLMTLCFDSECLATNNIIYLLKTNFR